MRNDWPHAGAFVLQLGPNTDFAAGRVEGRVEHVATTRWARFGTLAELVAFLREAMEQTGVRSQESGVRSQD